MNLKKILIGGLMLIIIFVIYLNNVDKKIYYVALGDSLAVGQNPYGKIGYGYSEYIADYLKKNQLLDFYTKKFAVSGYKATDLVNDIEANKKVLLDNNKELTIKTALVKADLITLSIGANDLFYKTGINSMNFDPNKLKNIDHYIDDISSDIESLIILIKKYCKEDIIMTGYYNPLSKLSSNYTRDLEPIFLYANDKLRAIAKRQHIYFIDIYDIFKENPEYLPNPKDIHPSTEGYEVVSSQIINIIEKNIID